MPIQSIKEAAASLFGLCAMAAGMDLLARDGRTGAAFRALCAFAVTARALRLVAALLKTG